MSTSFSLYRIVRRSLALAAFAGAGLAVAGAQIGIQTGTQNVASGDVSASSPLLQSATPLQTASARPEGAPAVALPAFSSSLDTASSQGYDPAQTAQIQLASLEKAFTPPGANMQYGQRRRYGAPRYRGGNTNADGSEKYTGYAGVGFDASVGTNSSYLTPSWAAQVGAGRNFNKHIGVMLEFNYDHFALSGAAVNYYAGLYGDPTNTSGFAGNNHIWDFSIQPVFQIYSGQGLGAYLTAGAGFYHKVTNFTYPETGYGCEYYYCGYYTENATIDHYTSNAPGFDAGIGVTYKFSRFSNERLYGEARFVYVDNQAKAGITAANEATYTGTNLFPENSNTTAYIPIKFGIRF